MEIVPYSDEHFEQLVAFLRENWAINHSLYEKVLFDWQYKGPSSDKANGLILLNDRDICGYVGGIPYNFYLDGEIKAGSGFAIWIVKKSIKNSGIGVLMRKAMEDKFDISYTIGINPNTVTMYEKTGYAYYEELNRYVLPLHKEGYKEFLLQDISEAIILKWTMKIETPPAALAAGNIDTEKLGVLYDKNIKPYFRLLPLKDSNFWKWRYVNSKGFKYYFFEGAGGIIIARIEAVHAPEDSIRHGLKCLRIIEIIPKNGAVWDGKADTAMEETILSALSWARQNKCVLADFQISNSRLDTLMKNVGFKKQGEQAEADIARLFSPLRFNARPLNFAYRVNGSNERIGREDTYFIKSDGDMDRPNFLC